MWPCGTQEESLRIKDPITATISRLTLIGVAQCHLARALTDARTRDGDCLGGAARAGYNSVGRIACGPMRNHRCSPLSAGAVVARRSDTACAGGCVPRPCFLDATPACVEARHAPGVASHRLWWCADTRPVRVFCRGWQKSSHPRLATCSLTLPAGLSGAGSHPLDGSSASPADARRQRSRPRSRDMSPPVHAAALLDALFGYVCAPGTKADPGRCFDVSPAPPVGQELSPPMGQGRDALARATQLPLEMVQMAPVAGLDGTLSARNRVHLDESRQWSSPWQPRRLVAAATARSGCADRGSPATVAATLDRQGGDAL